MLEAAAGSPEDVPNDGWVIHALRAAVAAICSTPLLLDRLPPSRQPRRRPRPHQLDPVRETFTIGALRVAVAVRTVAAAARIETPTG